MELSVSLPDEDVAFLDARVAGELATSRSAALHQAVQLLRRADLETDYAEAFSTAEPGEDELWDAAVGDGLRSTWTASQTCDLGSVRPPPG